MNDYEQPDMFETVELETPQDVDTSVKEVIDEGIPPLIQNGMTT